MRGIPESLKFLINFIVTLAIIVGIGGAWVNSVEDDLAEYFESIEARLDSLESTKADTNWIYISRPFDNTEVTILRDYEDEGSTWVNGLIDSMQVLSPCPDSAIIQPIRE